MLRILIVAILTTAADQMKLPTTKHLDLVHELCKNGGNWILAAVGSNGITPPNKSCITVTFTDDGTENGCILVAHNHTVHKAKVIRIVGINEDNETDIYSEGPIHQYMIKYNETKVNKELRNEVDWDAAINSPMCWSPKTHKLRSLRYIVTPIEDTTEQENLYLVSISPRTPIPEFQVAILTKTKMLRKILAKLIKMVNYRNFKLLESRKDTPGLFVKYGLPRLQMACAEGFDMHDPYDTINQEILDMKFDKDLPPFPNREFRKILVKHQ